MNIMNITVFMALFAVVATLIWGLGSMAHGGTYDRKHSERLMFTRIGIQTVAFALILLAILFSLS